ncbi:hypothetical protein [Methanosarcina horonobensis]|uniref:hypothetical protein n=1 Tax=Methanosarcina horonobensis TaxID=418008 RepID=UPI0022B8698F|nr:hypothetical protein [Methanosarcina horonobensis]
MDIAMILGASSQIRVLPVSEQLAGYDFPFMFLISLALIIFGITGKKTGKMGGSHNSRGISCLCSRTF